MATGYLETILPQLKVYCQRYQQLYGVAGYYAELAELGPEPQFPVIVSVDTDYTDVATARASWNASVESLSTLIAAYAANSVGQQCKNVISAMVPNVWHYFDVRYHTAILSSNLTPPGGKGISYKVGDTSQINGGTVPAFLAVTGVLSAGTGLSITISGLGAGNSIGSNHINGSGGTGYNVGDEVNILGGTTNAVLQVLSVNGGTGAVVTYVLLTTGLGYATGNASTSLLSSTTGGVLSYTLSVPGDGFTTGPKGTTALSGGHGTGLIINVTSVGIHSSGLFAPFPDVIWTGYKQATNGMNANRMTIVATEPINYFPRE